VIPLIFRLQAWANVPGINVFEAGSLHNPERALNNMKHLESLLQGMSRWVKTDKWYHLRHMLIAALFKIAKLWKQSRCATTDEWIKKMWYLYTMEFYSATKKNEVLSFTSKWVELENIILSEVSQAQKAKTRMFSLICRLET
jgi:hypothetical protein